MSVLFQGSPHAGGGAGQESRDRQGGVQEHAAGFHKHAQAAALGALGPRGARVRFWQMHDALFAIDKADPGERSDWRRAQRSIWGPGHWEERGFNQGDLGFKATQGVTGKGPLGYKGDYSAAIGPKGKGPGSTKLAKRPKTQIFLGKTVGPRENGEKKTRRKFG